jgi:hypothetical protein
MKATTSTLRAQQQAFEMALRAPECHLPEGLLAPAPGGGATRFDIYHHAYAARLVAALRDNFEILARAMGDEAFDTLGRAYLAAQPSQQPSIRWFGHRLAEFMDAHAAADDGLVPHPALADLARLDWALREAFDAADAEPLAATALLAVPSDQWPALCFELHPSVRRLDLQWAVASAWHVLKQAAAGAEPELPAPEPAAHTLLVWRRGLATHWRVLPPPEAAALRPLADGARFDALCVEAAQAIGCDADAAAAQVVAWLQQWLADGLLAGLSH